MCRGSAEDRGQQRRGPYGVVPSGRRTCGDGFTRVWRPGAGAGPAREAVAHACGVRPARHRPNSLPRETLTLSSCRRRSSTHLLITGTTSRSLTPPGTARAPSGSPSRRASDSFCLSLSSRLITLTFLSAKCASSRPACLDWRGAGVAAPRWKLASRPLPRQSFSMRTTRRLPQRGPEVCTFTHRRHGLSPRGGPPHRAPCGAARLRPGLHTTSGGRAPVPPPLTQPRAGVL